MAVAASGLESARATLDRARAHLLDLQHPDGWWKGELETNVTIDAEDLFLRYYLGILDRKQTESSARWIRSRQREDGSWATFHGGPFDLSTTIGILLKKKLDLFRPSPYFAWVVHLDGLRDRHDAGVGRNGVFDKAVEAIGEAKRRGFKVTTNTTLSSADSAADVRALLDFLNDELRVDSMMISPAFAYEQAPDQEHFPGVEEARELFRELFSGGARKRWRFNHTPLFLDFLEGKTEFECTAWGIPCYTLFGWQRPCYLMADGYVESYAELIETTEWAKHGRGRDARCANCLAHCGYEPTAVAAATRSLRQSLRAFASGG